MADSMFTNEKIDELLTLFAYGLPGGPVLTVSEERAALVELRDLRADLARVEGERDAIATAKSLTEKRCLDVMKERDAARASAQRLTEEKEGLTIGLRKSMQREDELRASAQRLQELDALRLDAIRALEASAQGMREALEDIAAWRLPEVVSRLDGRAVPYAVEYGSNGERDLVRQWARAALTATPPSAAGASEPICSRCAGTRESSGYRCAVHTPLHRIVDRVRSPLTCTHGAFFHHECDRCAQAAPPPAPALGALVEAARRLREAGITLAMNVLCYPHGGQPRCYSRDEMAALEHAANEYLDIAGESLAALPPLAR